ncbi:flavin reductase (NADPH) [Acrasis kona]|uniref:Flavin reductase (NADPH) n=1 Tax=Acrasis kona TaxID=1008807 RepID=A0AAW2YUL2_9EUKA
MRVAVFGCTGKTGKYVVDYLISNGISISVLVRDKKKLGPVVDNPLMVQITEGSPRDFESVKRTIEGSDVVVSCLGTIGYGNESEGLMLASCRNFVEAMKQCGVKKLVIMGGIMVAAPKDGYTLASLVRPVLYFMPAFQDAVELMKFAQSDEVKSSIDWIIVRAPRLIDNDLNVENYAHYKDCLMTAFTRTCTFQSAAHFIVEVAKQASAKPNEGDTHYWIEYLHESPTIIST